jgi:hypothetical protein
LPGQKVWPDWANFRPLTICQLWAVFFKITEVSQIFGLLYSRVIKLCNNFDNNAMGYNLGNFFYKIIWSPWPRPSKMYTNWDLGTQICYLSGNLGRATEKMTKTQDTHTYFTRGGLLIFVLVKYLSRVTRRVCKKSPKRFPNRFFCQYEYITTDYRETKENILGYFGNFQKKLPKVNTRPIGENSPNLVTLYLRIVTTKIRRI